ncbi:universal stress protein [Streptomyces iconiensis]|uniref:Universal stress protein n=1 Tax=Streptomyces iconiensis TaxID=1384038 RepID=A0ABT7A2F3_9ACTN|nr:universal stress protein [Streptomyces iconiensis]MDJ1135494.1 universal stress protein [Streptomyces iconiensis]
MEELPLAVGVDGSEPSLHALDWAVDEAIRRGVALRVIHAREGGDQEAGEHILAPAAERARLRGNGLDVRSEAVAAEPAAALLDGARNALAVVTGSRGRGEIRGLLLGSVSLELAQRADCPVIVVRGDEPHRQGTFHRITLGVGMEQDSAAVRFAFREAEERGGELRALRAWRCPTQEVGDLPLVGGHPAAAHQNQAWSVLDAALRDWMRKHPGVTVHQDAVEGTARKVLLDASADSDLMIVGAHRRQGHFGRQLGMVGHTLLHHAACPVAVVPEHI